VKGKGNLVNKKKKILAILRAGAYVFTICGLG